MGLAERRQFIRVRTAIPVRYKFVTPSGEKVSDALYEGSTVNLSSGGLLLLGKLPDPSVLVDLLMQRTWISLNMMLPGDAAPVKAIARAVWAERYDEATGMFPVGYYFEEIADADKSQIQRHVIRAQIG